MLEFAFSCYNVSQHLALTKPRPLHSPATQTTTQKKINQQSGRKV